MATTALAPKQRRPSRDATYTLLVADPSADARASIAESLSGIGPHVVDEAADVAEFERLFFEKGPYDLVVCRWHLGGQSGLDVLAKARARGRRASFLVYSSMEQGWLRVFVSDSEETVLSSRVVSRDGLAHLAHGLLLSRR